MLALEDATGESIDEDKKELANEEMIITGEISEEIGPEKATGIMNSIKTEIIKNNTSDTTQIAETINNVTNNYNITLNATQEKKIEELMAKISQQDYNYKEMKDTLENINKDINTKLDEMGESIQTGILDTIKGWFSGFGEWVSGLFNSSEKDLGILENTNDSLLGENVQIDATNKDAINLPSSEEVEGFFNKIWSWFTGLFNSNEPSSTENNVSEEDVLFDGEESPIDIDENLNTESSQDIDSSNNTSTETNTSQGDENLNLESSQPDNLENSDKTSNDELNTPSNEGLSE